MLAELNDYNWEEAFKYANGTVGCGGEEGSLPTVVLQDTVSAAPFSREDVKRILYLHAGKNDEDSWVGVFELHDGRFAMLSAWCDYTGWG